MNSLPHNSLECSGLHKTAPTLKPLLFGAPALPANPIPLVLLPGLLNDHRLWQHQQPALAASRPVLIPDLTQDLSLEAMARRVLDQAPEQFALAALSMGGYVAMEILRLAPQRVLKLALFDTMARPDSEARAKVRRGMLNLAELGKFKGVTPQLLPRLMHARSLDTPAAQIVLDMAETIGKDGFIRQQQAIIDRPDYMPVLQQVKVPALIVVGAEDGVTPQEESELMHRSIAGSTLVVIAQCGHLPPLEHPERTLELLQNWLGDEGL
jgi:pimeloyl-ACP methyl ester carboxylesterase